MRIYARRKPIVADRNEEELIFEEGIPTSEIDEPLNFSSGDTKVDDTLEVRKMEADERDKNRKEKRYFSAFKLIIGCIIFLLFIYCVETILAVAVTNKLSDVTDGIIEIIKTLLFRACGRKVGLCNA